MLNGGVSPSTDRSMSPSKEDPATNLRPQLQLEAPPEQTTERQSSHSATRRCDVQLHDSIAELLAPQQHSICGFNQTAARDSDVVVATSKQSVARGSRTARIPNAFRFELRACSSAPELEVAVGARRANPDEQEECRRVCSAERGQHPKPAGRDGSGANCLESLLLGEPLSLENISEAPTRSHGSALHAARHLRNSISGRSSRPIPRPSSIQSRLPRQRKHLRTGASGSARATPGGCCLIVFSGGTLLDGQDSARSKSSDQLALDGKTDMPIVITCSASGTASSSSKPTRGCERWREGHRTRSFTPR